MYNIVIVGLGALGRRHLQSILDMDLELDITCVDIIRNGNETLGDFDYDSNIKLRYTYEMSELPHNIDLAIIATSSAPRRVIFEELISKAEVKNLIFEKVLFQKMEDYFAVKKMIVEKGIKVWVNCARREWQSYQELARWGALKRPFLINVYGGEWGLACNGIHMLDLIEYIVGAGTISEIKCTLLDEIAESKRQGYKEVYGNISGKVGKYGTFNITCMKGSDVPFVIEFVTAEGIYRVLEDSGKLEIYDKDREYQCMSKSFSVEYQSQLTSKIVESILSNGCCNLPQYEESMELHIKMLSPMLDFFKGYGLDYCPIT